MHRWDVELMIFIRDVKSKCFEGRFYEYTNPVDRCFAHVSIYLVWVFVNCGVSAGAVSWLSAAALLVGSSLVAYGDPNYVFIGSFGYIIFYVLDYADGSVARFNNKGSVSGQYLDWIMHVVFAVAFMMAIAIGAIQESGIWVVPFAIFAVVAAALSLARFSMAWFAIGMEIQQNQFNANHQKKLTEICKERPDEGMARKLIRGITTIVFHENYIIFTMPLLAFSDLYVFDGQLPYMTALVVFGGAVYFPVMVMEIHKLASSGYLSTVHNNLFHRTHKPDLPKDSFFK